MQDKGCRTKDIPKIGKYIGETCRSIEERNREHVDKYEIKNNDSVLYQHMLDKHNGELRSVKTELVKRCPGDAMLRQVSESVYIRELEPELNRKDEFNNKSVKSKK